MANKSGPPFDLAHGPEPAEGLLSVVIPVYNEKDFLAQVVRLVQATPYRKEIVIVDDASTDGTREVVDQLRSDEVRVFHHERNQGKGAALRTGFAQTKGDIVLIQDADLEYSPADYPTLLQPILDGRADAVFGSRFLGGPHRVMFFWHRVGNAMLTTLSNMMTNLDLSDMETGYKVFRGDLARSLRIKSNRFSVEPEMTAKLARMKVRIYETPISYSGRDYAQGKKITWRDGFSALWHIFRFRFFD
ncbi:MAG: glycosyltransferase family 2 protein [Candidatus Brocadiia bacterium]